MRKKNTCDSIIMALTLIFSLIIPSYSYAKIVGILGGLGPHTTSVFYLDVVNHYIRATKNKNRPSILVWSVPLNLEKESNFIHHGYNKKYILRQLAYGVISLDKAGVDFVVIPCNTVHTFLPYLKKITPNIKYLSIIEETAKYAQKTNIKKVLLLATSQTIRSKLYTKPLTQRNILVMIPNKHEQETIDHIILNIIQNKKTPQDKKMLKQIINKYHAKGVNQVILGCTDLQEIINRVDYKNIDILDSMSILAKATAAEAVKN